MDLMETNATHRDNPSTQRMMEGKVVVVTGSGGGIGRDIALAMAREGARVVVNDVGASLSGEGQDGGPAQAVVTEVRAAGGEAVANTDSVADPQAAQRLIGCALDSFGRLDAVVNNAGILRDGFFHKMGDDQWDAVIKVHLYGSYYVSRAAANHFKEQEAGCFIHMTSTSGLIGEIGQANYAAAKMGIAALSKSIALDMRKFNVRSNCIAPFAFSRMISSMPTDTPEQRARVERLKEMTPAKIAPLAVCLSSELAADTTGQIFAVRNNEIFLMSQPRPLRSIHRSEGWTPNTVASHALPALRAQYHSLDRSGDVFRWDPV
jgi:NAD(P)-dependent dehydrogenase (short-subunit alcohol dehydrogenase family)